jgi:hypothetical protein
VCGVCWWLAAIEIFERAGTEAVDDRLLKYGAKEHFFKAGLCHLAAAVYPPQSLRVGQTVWC